MMQTNKKERYLALDLGEKRIGVAINDELNIAAHPLTMIERKNLKYDLAQIDALLKENSITKLIVGVPITLSDKISAQAQKILSLIEIFKKTWAIPIEQWDEALTSKEAEKILIKADMSRKKRKQNIDKLAATFILQSYMDAHP